VDDATSGLFDRATRGDRPALDALLVRYLPQMHAFVHARLGPGLRPRESSLDVVQSVCRQLLASRPAFEFRGEERFRAWLFTAALNKIRERHRRAHDAKRDVRRELRVLDAGTASVVAKGLSPSQAAIGAETAAAIAESLAALSEEHREVITLARFARLPHSLIAEAIGRTEAATRQFLGRALLALARELQRRGVEVEQSL
jgi:RNA polymerase sigma-70 factor (ECF subfamily)